MSLFSFLFDRLWEAGVRQVFGIPGDFVLNLYNALEADGRFQIVRLSHEPAVGFAADGAARIRNGLGVCCVTYGAGGLNMVNAVACAYAEESPLVVISGGPGRAERRAGIHVHHEVKSFESQLRIYKEVTAFAAILDDPADAAAQILRALDVAVRLTRPVYLEIPRDMVDADITMPATLLAPGTPPDPGAVREAARELGDRLSAASHPVLITGVEVHRLGLRDAVIRLAERLGAPVASSFLGRGAFPVRHPQFAGTYLGVVSPPVLRDIVETSDCVLLIGETISDTGLGVSADRLTDRNLLLAVADDVFVGHHRYERAPLPRVVEALLADPRLVRPGRFRAAPAPPPASTPRGEAPITIAGVIETVNHFFDTHPDVPLVADTGDALFASVEIRANECVAPAYYATMGFAIPAALGLQVASGRRPLVLVGDGAFQMTGAEVSHAPAYGCTPVILLLNNCRWEMLQAFFPNARYNDTPAWPFTALAEAWGGRGIVARTGGELRRAIDEAWAGSQFVVIEIPLAAGDISPTLRGFVDAFKARVYRAPAAPPD